MIDYDNTQPDNQANSPTYSTLPEKVRHYDIPSNSGYYANLSDSEKTVAILNPSKLESIIQNTKPQYQNMAGSIMHDKLLMLRATIELIKQLINNRTKIKQDNITNIDYEIQQCRNYLLNLEVWPIFNNSLVEAKRANLGQTISKMESEIRQENSKCWNDQVRLYQELLKIMGEYKAAHRRNSLLSINATILDKKSEIQD